MIRPNKKHYFSTAIFFLIASMLFLFFIIQDLIHGFNWNTVYNIIVFLGLLSTGIILYVKDRVNKKTNEV